MMRLIHVFELDMEFSNSDREIILLKPFIQQLSAYEHTRITV